MNFRQGAETNLATVSIRTWHIREIINKNNFNYKDNWNGYNWGVYPETKQDHYTHQIQQWQKVAWTLLILIGEINERSLGSSKHFLLLKNGYSDFKKIYFVKQESETTEKLKTFLNIVENQFGRAVKMIKTNNKTEIKSAKNRKLFNEKGILHLLSTKYTSEKTQKSKKI